MGTKFKPKTKRHQQQELESWLFQKIEPRIDFRFFEFEYQGLPVVILEIQPAIHKPVCFDGTEFIRIGSYTKKLRGFPEKERELWRILDHTPFEKQVAMKEVSGEKVLELIDFTKYFDMTKQTLPQDRQGILAKLQDDKLIVENAGLWDISNLGAILFAKKLSDFDHLAKKVWGSDSFVIENSTPKKAQNARKHKHAA